MSLRHFSAELVFSAR